MQQNENRIARKDFQCSSGSKKIVQLAERTAAAQQETTPQYFTIDDLEESQQRREACKMYMQEKKSQFNAQKELEYDPFVPQQQPNLSVCNSFQTPFSSHAKNSSTGPTPYTNPTGAKHFLSDPASVASFQAHPVG